MHRTPITLALLLAGWLLAGAAHAQVNALPPTRHVLVYGDAQARAIPDRFKITVNLQAVDLDADAARQRVEASLSQVLRQLDAAGAEANETVATSLRIETRQRYDDKLREEVFVGTSVNRSVTARFDAKEKLERFIASVQTSKELTIGGVDTELAGERALRAALREKTIASSREKADVIARAYGARLGGVYSVSDVAPQFEYGIREGSWPALYEWRGRAGATSLDRIEVTGSRLSPEQAESFRTGYVTYTDKIYTVFLLAD